MPVVLTNKSKSPLQKEIERICGVNLDTCMQCGTCTGGCSGIEYMDYSPRQVIQLIKLNQREKLLKSKTIWMCVSCHICEDRCPAAIRIPLLMDALREMAVADPAIRPNNPQTIFHNVFLDQVKSFGRVHEALLSMTYSRKANMPLPSFSLMFGLVRRFRVDLKPPHRASQQFRSTVNKLREGDMNHD